ncbi:hypothetical protein KAI04_00280 [Candidatus Pacearchaeota archaeon]|nr:hypothetical protein [Candidatus Pacearchaeota archaeon]
MKNIWMFLFLALFLVSMAGLTLAEENCTDTDGGIDYYTKGVINTNIGQYAGMNLEDSCNANEVWVHEKYCNEDGTVGFEDYACANEDKVCKDGACVEVESNLGCRGLRCDLFLYQEVNLDICEEEFIFKLRGVSESDDGEIYEVFFDFGGVEEIKSQELREGDEFEYNDLENGEVVFKVKALREGFIPYEDYFAFEYIEKCFQEPYCIDNDGGINYYEMGQIDTNMEQYAGMNLKDSCNADGVWLHEKYCNEDGTVGFKDHACANEGKICIDGACVNETEENDSDDNDVNENGTRKVKLNIKNRLRINQSEIPEGCTASGSTLKCNVDGGRVMAVFAGNSGNTIFQVKGINASTKVELYKENDSFYGVLENNETFLINYFPDEIKEIVRNRINVSDNEDETIELDEKGIYQVQTKKRARLFYLVPVKEKIKTQVDPETGEIIKTRNPWWGFLAKDIIDVDDNTDDDSDNEEDNETEEGNESI